MKIPQPASAWSSTSLALALLAIGASSCGVSIEVPGNLNGSTSNSSSTSPDSISLSYSLPSYSLEFLPSGSTYAFFQGYGITALAPTTTGTIDSFSISPALPAGLSFDTATGQITGTPTALSSSRSYTITASSGSSTAQATLTFTVGHNFTVDSTADDHDSDPGDGVCNNGSGACTLRAAIEEVSGEASASPALIQVPAGTYTLTIGTVLSLTQAASIVGADESTVIIDGGTSTRVLNIAPASNGSATLENLTVENGKTSTLDMAGGITFTSSGSGNLSLTSVSMLDNSGSAMTGAGAIYFDSASGNVTIQDSTLEGNSETADPANYTAAGLLKNLSGGSGSATVTGTVFDDNTSGTNSGGIYNLSGDLTISQSTFTNNSGGEGGAVFSPAGDSFSLVVDLSLFQGNSAMAGGAIATSSVSTISNSTFYNNHESNFFGDAIYFEGNSTLEYCTITGNTGATLSEGGAIAIELDDNVNVTGTILSANTGGTDGNCYSMGALTSLGYNIDDADNCGFASAGDLVNTDPLLVSGAPANNGGPTDTIALQTGSPAIGAIPDADCGVTTDQRGDPRPNASGCDIGAYEK